MYCFYLSEKMEKLRARFRAFIETNKQYPLIVATAAGLPPMLHYYNSNFWQVNSLEQLTYFFIFFICIPVVILFFINFIFKSIQSISKYRTLALLCLNIIFFVTFTLFSTIGISTKRVLLVCFLAVILSFIFKKYLKKIVVFELLLTIVLFINLIPNLFDSIFYSDNWMKFDDDIETVEFKKKPNIYLIQPDGYANFSELKKDNYNFDNSKFEMFLSNSGFKLYPNFRSNYYTTLSSNASMFSMKHHYYNNPKQHSNELAKSREIIAGKNSVISIFKNNGYKTFLLLQKPYLIINRPQIVYDYCNISYDELPYINQGFGINKNIENDLEQLISDNPLSSNFYFIEQIAPGHISTHKKDSKGINLERIKYLESLKSTNNWLKNIISLINQKDKESIIIVAADHGGFVGMTNTRQSKSKQISETLVMSVFTAVLAVKWPDSTPPHYEKKLETSVNLFRILFTYLSDDEKYLKNLEANESYIIINKGAKFGSYLRIDNSGNVVFKRKQ